ncbi:hypothetical protein QQF64_002033 [Cirrhinus molitorella]|uniref:Uncharacterized protein n=1 Tax=Cirrhinus molitorella TaxID=172907 RepID=A0ABR3MP08_9TELE
MSARRLVLVGLQRKRLQSKVCDWPSSLLPPVHESEALMNMTYWSQTAVNLNRATAASGAARRYRGDEVLRFMTDE